ncbi:MAG: hypothetical protein K6E14_00505 [Paludibacteraceae bacterium]|nr:hypothetical protein [Paludibacteraceae bacterium]
MGTANKGQWYKLLIDKMDQAIKNKYYFEAVFIEYMIIDDRLKSMAELAGVNLVKSDGSPKMMGQLIDDIKEAKKTLADPRWKTLDISIPIASKEFLKSIKKDNYPLDRIYECTHVPRMLVNTDKSKKSGKILSKYGAVNDQLLVQIQAWANLRNHWMHAAGDDALTLEEYEADITPLAIDGASFARELCDITKRIKRHMKK